MRKKIKDLMSALGYPMQVAIRLARSCDGIEYLLLVYAPCSGCNVPIESIVLEIFAI